MTSTETWIVGNFGLWHLAKVRELLGAKTGKVYSSTLVAACSGRQVGGAYGYSAKTERPAEAGCCARCLKLASKVLS